MSDNKSATFSSARRTQNYYLWTFIAVLTVANLMQSHSLLNIYYLCNSVN